MQFYPWYLFTLYLLGGNEMSVKKIDVTGKYGHEIQDITNKLKDLENSRIYEITGARMDGYLATNIKQLDKMIKDLIYKIEYGEDSVNDKLAQVFDKYSI